MSENAFPRRDKRQPRAGLKRLPNRPLTFDALEDRCLLSGTITGTVFQDYDANGVFDQTATINNTGGFGTTGLAIDRGIGNVTVTAVDAAGAVRGSATSAANGTYSLAAAGTGPYRLQFTLPGGFLPAPQGASGGGPTQFVPDGNSAGVNLGLVVPQDYVQDNPDLVATCYVLGDQISGPNKDHPVIISFPFNAGSNAANDANSYGVAPAHALAVPASAVGTVWGLGYDAANRTLYAASYMKKHSGFGPNGTGAVYAVNRDTGAVSVLADLNALFGGGTAGTNPHNTGNYADDNFDQSFAAVGKTALGGLDVSPDGATVYVMNLADRRLYAIPTAGPVNTATVKSVSIPINAPGATGTNGADLRPFAVQYYKGKVYVGVVNSAETTQRASDLLAYVYTVDPTTLTFSTAPVFQMALNYPRGRTQAQAVFPAAWNPWVATYAATGMLIVNQRVTAFPQPMLTGIAFDADGNLVLGLRDRFGDQSGPNQPVEPGTSSSGNSTGDTLRAFIRTPGDLTSGWVLESNGRGPNGEGAAPQNTGQGPGTVNGVPLVNNPANQGNPVTGSGEFYSGDNLPAADPANSKTPTGNDHDELSLGSVLQLPGRPDVIVSAFDPAFVLAAYNRGGVRFLNNTTGGFDKGYELYNDTDAAAFAKANGIGDLTVFTDPAPIQIGNRVWSDANNNGIQDANEPGINGVAVTLLYAGPDGVFGNADDKTFTTTTAGGGVYLFDGSDVVGGVVPGGKYQVRIDKTQAALAGTTLSPANQGTDATVNSKATTSGNLAVIAVTAGVPGQSDQTLDAGFNPQATASLAGKVFRDDNDNGTQDTGEPGLGSVIVALTGTDVNSQPVNLQLATAADGSYIFTGLLAGTYTVTETQPPQYSDGKDTVGSSGGNLGNDVISVIVLNAGVQAAGYTFGERGTFLSGTVYVDANRNGALDGGEAGLAGVTLTLKDGSGTTLGTTTTAADGSYRFDNLQAANYSVVETQPAGFGSSTPNTLAVTVTLAGLPNQNFGETAGSIGGTVYRDDNNNGLKDAGEPGLGGVTVSLTSTPAAGGNVNLSTTTAADGTYLFDGLAQGTYTVTETQPAAYNDGKDAVGSSGGTLGNDVVSAIALAASAQATGYNFGERGTTLSGVVYVDANKNAVLDAGESGLSGVTLTLKSDAATVATTTTAADGSYSFTNLAAGAYSVVETQPPAYGSSTPNTLGVTVPLAGATNQNFGETGGSLAGKVFRDDNDNGTQDTAEPGLVGVTVSLSGTDANNQPVSRATTTGLDGSFLFATLPQGTYTLTETQPAQYADGKDTLGNAGGTAGNDTFANIALGSAVDGTGYTFGERGTTLSGLVYVDSNVNGVKDAGETGLANVTLTLRDPNGIVLASTATAADGSYSFMNLAAGPYTVAETQPVGYGSSTPNSLPVNLPTTGLPNQNFGETTASLAGKVYRDDNNDGVQGPAEPGIAGVTVTLAGTDANNQTVSKTTTTGLDGSYLFAGLVQGVYTLTETQPANYNDGSDALGSAGGTLSNDVVSAIPLGTGFAGTGYNFGERGTTLSGVVYVDANANGTRETGENGLPSVTLTVRDGNGNVLASTTTGPDGSYLFSALLPGTYALAETQPAGYGSSTPNTFNVTVPLAGLPNQNFGETTSSLAGKVFRDDNNDGTQNGTEPGIGSVTLTLTGTDANSQAVSKTATSAADGTFSFTGLLQGTYTLTETQPAGFSTGKNTAGSAGGTFAGDVVSGITLPAGTAAAGYTFGEQAVTGTTAVSGFVFIDNNANQARDTGEPGILGVTVTLKDGGGATVGTATTGADGSYAFNSVTPAAYTIVETQPAGFGSSTPNTLAVVVPSAGLTNQNFGETTSSLAGKVFRDDNNNGTQDTGEPGIGSVTLTLTGTDAKSQAVNKTATSAADGSYSFTGLLQGTYTLTETQPTGFSTGKNTAGSAGGTFAGDVVSGVALPAGTAATGYTFGELATTGSVSGVVFIDANANQARDAGESGLGGVTLTLKDSNGATVATTTTAADGTYSFNNLTPGNYQLVETQPTGYGSSTPNTLNGAVPAGVVPNQNFGETTSSLAGKVFRDDNNDGTQNGTEPGIGSATLNLTGTDANSQAVTKTTTTAADGSFSFTGLLQGTYTISEPLPSGFTNGKVTVGSAGGTSATAGGTDTVSAIPLPAGTVATGYTFGEQVVAGTTTVSGFVFIDGNANQTRDTGEPGIPGVTVTLKNSGGTTVGTVATSPDGSYTFNNVAPGTYSLVETQPTGYAADTPLTLNATVPAAGLPNQNFGQKASSLAGAVFLDNNNNGTPDAGELGLVGVTLTLTGTDANNQTVNKTTATANDGSFFFANLLQGTYTLTETQPGGLNSGKNTAGSAGGTLTGDVVSAITLPAGTAGAGYLFAEVPQNPSITGFVFLDSNGNGTKDAAEPGLAGVAMTLKDTAGNTGATATTAADGSYTFLNVPPANYSIVETQPVGFGSSTPNTLNVTLTAAGLTNQNFGETASSLAGKVFRDDNNNGAQDTGEPGVAGVTLTLTGTDANSQAVNKATTTAADGTYSFGALLQGTYTLTETQPAGLNSGKNTAGNAGGTFAGDVVSGIALPAGTAAIGYTFGEVTPPPTSTVSGVVFLDANGNGTRDAGEAGLGGVTLTLKNSSGATVATTTTAADGTFKFNGVTPGNYQLVETQPAGFGSSTPNALAISVPAGGLVLSQNFGEVAAPVISKAQLLASTVPLNAAPAPDLAPFVSRLYTDLLQRTASASEVSARVAQLQAGLSPKDLARSVWTSPEHRGIQVDNFYHQFLGRNADPAGRAGYVNALLNGLSEADAITAFVTSPEYTAKHPDAASFVSALYTDILGRAADDAGKVFWVGQVASAGRAAVAKATLTSTECNQKLVNDYFRLFLGRAADPAGLSFWVSRLQAGVSFAEVGWCILGSDEYLARR